MGVVTISATYGAGGSEVGPAVADALGLPFVDRAIPASVARKLVHRHPGQDEAALRQALRDNDGARAAYVRNLYQVDPCDCRLYHLVVDSTALGWDTVTELVVTAARARGIGDRG